MLLGDFFAHFFSVSNRLLYLPHYTYYTTGHSCSKARWHYPLDNSLFVCLLPFSTWKWFFLVDNIIHSTLSTRSLGGGGQIVPRNTTQSHHLGLKPALLDLEFNLLPPRAFSQKRISWTLWTISGWMSARLALIKSKRHLQHDNLPFFPPASHFTPFWLEHTQKSSLGFSIF